MINKLIHNLVQIRGEAVVLQFTEIPPETITITMLSIKNG